MGHMTKSLLSLAIISGLSITSANATNGMFLIGSGVKANGMGGAAIAYAQDSTSLVTNPALMSQTGTRFDIGGDLFFAFAEASLGEQEDIKSVAGMGVDNMFVMPIMSATYQYSDDISFGFAATPLGGGGSDYELNLFNATGNARSPNERLGIELIVMNMLPSISYKLNDNSSIGASLVIGLQRFRAEGLGLFDIFTSTQTTDNLTNQGNEYSYGLGFRIGWNGQYLNNKLQLGAVYTTRTYMTKFSQYSELFAEGGDLDTPGYAGLGISYAYNDKLDIAFDITQTFYSDINAISNTGPNITGTPLGGEDRRLGLDNGLGFGWDDQTIYKIGFNYQYSDSWAFRSGWNYGKSPINEKREIIFNIAAPAVTQHHFTMGASYRLSADSNLDFSFIRAFKFKQFGPTYIGNPAVGSISMEQYSLGVSYSSAFSL